MFIHTLFKKSKPEPTETCYAEKLLDLVLQLLEKELPEHLAHHHILFTANFKLESLNDSLNHHRSQVNHQLKLGQFHTQMYHQLQKQVSDLQMLVDSYMELNINMKQMNHRLHFHYDQINYLHYNYILFMEGRFSDSSSHLFWQTLREDVLVIIRKVL
ncbi:hypothetical protein [Ureibacillus sinduriensis]|uniref:Uncharacterized protein n=1 Tax=Ureibacillus sinduriensis BLB-1 = JCM 15800 TaxID=1384057 RepID=A0A0A3HQ56_9BACL|nr:hypothetical protein [Ureibacillus sinduriensis]KGR74539.1 hypothetical protein CD33_15700 [Ureibacillus sinduriensis BLB-1 = JCM 15800]